MVLRGSRGCAPRSALLAVLLSLSALTVSPDSVSADLRVFDGEYIVAPKISKGVPVAASLASGATSKDLGRSGLKLLQQPPKESLSSASTPAAGGKASVLYDPAADSCKALLKTGLYSKCSPNFEYKISVLSNDPQLSDVWGLSSSGIEAAGAWDVSTGSNQIVVAVIDTGVDYNHPDLARNMWVNPGEIPGNGRDDDANGWVDDVHGINAFSGTGNPMDDNGHGTHVAGTIGAVGNNSVGMVGVNWNVKIMALKFLGASGSGSLADAITALDYMVMMKGKGVNVRVSNNSWGGGGYSSVLEDAVRRTSNAGIFFAAAAGNEGEDNDVTPSYPANFDLPNLISVAAIDRNGNMPGFSNYGPLSVDIAAPGVEILSTAPGASYRRLSGTSMATPHVAGAAALLLSNEPTLTPEQVIGRMVDSGSDLATLTGIVSSGRKLNASRLLKGLTSPISQPGPLTQPCSYAIEEIGFDPDRSADGNAIVAQGDEFNFHHVNLPFEFPFFGDKIRAIDVSLNGVIYTRGAPSTPDYQSRDSAPRNAIAALWTDLNLPETPFGVRVASSSEKVTVFWHARQYTRPLEGGVMARVSLYPNGNIESSLQIIDPVLVGVLRGSATLGISGGTGTTPLTYSSSAAGSELIRDGLAIRYAASCPVAPLPTPAPKSVQSVSIRGMISNGLAIDGKVFRGKSLELDIAGSGSGMVDLKLGFNDQLCPSAIGVSLSSGQASLSGILPGQTPRRFRKISAVVESVRSSARIVADRAKPGRRRGSSKLSSRSLQRFCDRLGVGLHQAQ